jgi:hypothetical protein
LENILFDFRWFYRQRIRIELSGPHAMDASVELHEQQLDCPEHRFADHALDDRGCVQKTESAQKPDAHLIDPLESNLESSSESFSRILPEYALNEVFIGESLSSRFVLEKKISPH